MSGARRQGDVLLKLYPGTKNCFVTENSSYRLHHEDVEVSERPTATPLTWRVIVVVTFTKMAHYVEVRCMLINVYCTVIFAHTST
jgi:hypothetical protein